MSGEQEVRRLAQGLGLAPDASWEELHEKVTMWNADRSSLIALRSAYDALELEYDGLALQYDGFRTRVAQVVGTPNNSVQAVLAQVRELEDALREAAARAAGYEDRCGILDAERLRLRKIASALLGRFENGQKVHPGYEGRSGGNMSTTEIAGIREMINQGVPSDTVPMAAMGWRFAVSPDGRRFASYDPGNGPWFIHQGGPGEFVTDAELDGWTVFTPGSTAVWPTPVAAPVPFASPVVVALLRVLDHEVFASLGTTLVLGSTADDVAIGWRLGGSKGPLFEPTEEGLFAALAHARKAASTPCPECGDTGIANASTSPCPLDCDAVQALYAKEKEKYPLKFAVDPAVPDSMVVLANGSDAEIAGQLDAWARRRVEDIARRGIRRWEFEADRDADPQTTVIDDRGVSWEFSGGLYVSFWCVGGMTWRELLEHGSPLLVATPFTLNPPAGWGDRVGEVLEYQGLRGEQAGNVAFALGNLVRSWVGICARDIAFAQGADHWGPRTQEAHRLAVAGPDGPAVDESASWPSMEQVVGDMFKASPIGGTFSMGKSSGPLTVKPFAPWPEAGKRDGTEKLAHSTGHEVVTWTSPDGRWTVRMSPSDEALRIAESAEINVLRAELEEDQAVDWMPDNHGPVAQWAVSVLKYRRRNEKANDERAERFRAQLVELNELLLDNGVNVPDGGVVKSVAALLAERDELRAAGPAEGTRGG